MESKSTDKEFRTDFIEPYRQHTFLWKIKSKECSDKQQGNDAYDMLLAKLKENDEESTRDTI